MENAGNEIGVYNEWGKLRTAFVGIAPDSMVEPEYMAEFNWMGEEGVEITRTYGGRKSIHVFPEKIEQLKQELENFVSLLTKAGVTVYRNIPFRYIEEERFLDDTQKGLVINGGADFFLVIGQDVILLNNLRYPFRRKQIFSVRPVLEPLLKNSSARYVAMPPASPYYDPTDPFLERGDVMLDGQDVYVGLSGNASNMAGVEWLKRYLGNEYKVHVIKLAENILHLDTVLTLNKSGLLTYYPEFIGELPAPLQSWDKIEVHQEKGEAMDFGANNLSIDGYTVVMAKQYNRLVDEYEKRGMKVILAPLDMNIEYGSGARCLVGVLARDK